MYHVSVGSDEAVKIYIIFSNVSINFKLDSNGAKLSVR